MRCLLGVLLIAVGWPAVGQEMPYTAYVSQPSAAVRSGPANDFYETDTLDWATKVEVYRHDNEVWAAIRPPESSFSWIPASAVERVDGEAVGIVAVDEIKTAIGSRTNDRLDADYLTLRRGESVEILGSANLRVADRAPEPYLKIAPPAGEFRWIALDDLSRLPPARSEIAAEPTATTVVDELRFPEQGVAEAETANAPAESAASTIELVQTQQENAEAPELENAGETDTLDLLEPPRSSDPLEPQAATPQPTERNEPSAIITPPRSELAKTRSPRQPLGPVGKLRLDQELIEIELQLTQQVAQPPESWLLSELDSRARAVIDTSDDAAQRQQAQKIIAKIAQLEDVKRRHNALLADLPQPLSTPNQILASTPPADAAVASTYDGVGWLMPVVTDRNDIPRYVLTDEDGNIKQFVSPKPGMNLRRFEQQKIGIFGQRGFLPTYNQPHLMAERVITLDKVR